MKLISTRKEAVLPDLEKLLQMRVMQLVLDRPDDFPFDRPIFPGRQPVSPCAVHVC